MAKESRNISYQKATITEENGIFMITEYLKDETKVYNLTDKLKEYVNVDGLSLKIAKDTELVPEE